MVDMEAAKKDIIFFDDGTGIKRKEGTIEKIEDALIFFSQSGKIQLIPICRIVRIEKGDAP